MEQNSKAMHNIEFKDLRTKIDLLKFNKREFSELANSMIFFVNESSDEEYPDFIDRPVFLISHKIAKIISKYQRDLLLRNAVLIERKSNKQFMYHLIIVNEIDCHNEKESLYTNVGSIKDLVLDPKKIGKNRIFMAKNFEKKRIIVNLAVAESILRRKSYGITFRKIKQTEEEILE